MNSSSFLRADGAVAPERHAWWSNWLPSLSQVVEASQFRLDISPLVAPSTTIWSITMRQGLGLVVVAALAAGLLPFLVHSVIAIRLGAPYPFVQLAQQARQSTGDSPSQLGEALQMLAGLSPAVLPGWLAALLSTIGEWINWPLRWLTWWLLYGTATLLAAKIWGAPATLQRFLAATSYAAAPMILTGLGPIPCLGVVAQIVAVAWMLVVYLKAVRAATGLDWGHSAMAMLLPAAILSVLAFALLLAVASTVMRMIF